MFALKNVYIFISIFFLLFLSGCIKSKIFDGNISEYARYAVTIKYAEGKVPQYEKREITVDLDGKKTLLPDNSNDKIIIRSGAEKIIISAKYFNKGTMIAYGELKFSRYDKNYSGKLLITMVQKKSKQ